MNEDWPDGYSDSASYDASRQTTAYREQYADWVDPFNDDYEHFMASDKF